RSAVLARTLADFNPDAFTSPRSVAGNASGHRKARIAMYSAVHGPIPGRSTSLATTAVGLTPGSRSIARRATALARLRKPSARAAGKPTPASVALRAAASVSAVGVRRFRQ